MPLQTGAYLALSRKFCGQVNIHSTINFFSRVLQSRNTARQSFVIVITVPIARTAAAPTVYTLRHLTPTQSSLKRNGYFEGRPHLRASG